MHLTLRPLQPRFSSPFQDRGRLPSVHQLPWGCELPGDLQTLLQPVVVLHDVPGFGAARGPQDQGEVDTQQVPRTGSVTTPA